MYDVISIGSSLVDIFLRSGDLETGRQGQQQILTYGDKIGLEDLHVYSGGGASNTAVAFARLGFKVAVISETGRDEFSTFLLKDFENEAVASNLLIQEKLERTGASVVLVAKNGERVVLTFRGAASQLDPFDIPSFWLSQARWVHLSNLSGRLTTLQKIFQSLSKAQETKLSWNPGKADLELLASGKLPIPAIPCEIFFVNQEEWQLVKEKQTEILKNFPQVVVTKGKAGGDLYLFSRHAFRYEGQAKTAVDATGAGDSFASAYVAATLHGLEAQKAIAWGVKNASSVISYFGAKVGLLHQERMESLVQD